MELTPELLKQLNEEDLAQARAMTGSQKLRAGGDLFDEACRWTMAGIRAQFPEMSDEDVRKELGRRLNTTESRG
jgi:hypothetical protein